eukprot:Seg1925.8 transcript_id=Seg1925.8/GoldUCD/mRNA.D3Y31 product=Neogenin protein_id=Seg1925.8/GoldUCD/D3Y31
MAMNSPSPMLNFDGRLSSAEVRFTLQDSTRNKTPFPDVIPEREVIRHDLGYHGPCPVPPTDERHTPVLPRPASASAVAPSPLCNNARIRQPAEPLHRGAEPLHENCMPSMLVSDTETERHCSSLHERKNDTFDGPACEVGRPDYADLDGPFYAVLDGPDASDGPDDADLNGPVYSNVSGPDYADNDGPDYADRDCPNSPAISNPDYGVYDEDDYAELSPVIIEKSSSLDLRNRPGYQPSKDELPCRSTERQSSMSMTHKDHLSHNSKPNYSIQETRLGGGMNRARPIITKSNTFTGRVKPFEMKQFTTGRTMTTMKESTHNSEPCSAQHINKKVTECVKSERDDIYLEPNAMVQEYKKGMSLKSTGAQEKTRTLPGSAIRPAFREKVVQVMEETRHAGDEEALYVTPNSVIPDLKRAHTEKSPSRAKDWAPMISKDRVGSPMKKREAKPLITTRLAAQDADTAIYAQPNAVIPEFKRAHTEKIRPRTPDIMSPTRPKYKVGKQRTAADLKFTLQPTNQYSPENYNASFECSATSTLRQHLNLLWKKNGVYINTFKQRRFKITPNGNLIIRRISSSDFGSYQCVAQSSHGAIVSQTARLIKAGFEVVGGIPNKTSTYNVKEGSYLYLKAPTIVSQPDATFEWKFLKKGTFRNIEPSREYVGSDGSLLILTLNFREHSDSIPVLFISTKFSRKNLFQYGKISITERLDITKNRCPEQSVMFLPTQQNSTINEGESVTLDCLAVYKRCLRPLTVTWNKGGETSWSANTRMLKLSNVKKNEEGSYICDAAFGQMVYNVKIIEKPKILEEPPRVIPLGIDGIIPGGRAQNATYVEWYTNAEKLPSESVAYQILQNSSLKVKIWSSSLAGLYQIFYQNEAGLVSSTIRVDILNGACGGKLTNASGEIDFFNSNLDATQCIWLLQFPAARFIKFNFTEFGFTGNCSSTYLQVYEGDVTSNTTNGYHFCSTTKPAYPVVLAGPYVTVYLQRDGRQSQSGQFRLIYRYNETERIPTTAVTTTQTTSTKATTTRKTTTAAAATTVTTTTTTTTTTTKAPKTKSTSTKKITEKETPTTTTADPTTEKSTASTVPPGEPETGALMPLSVLIGVSVGAVIVIIIIMTIVIFCFRQRRRKRSTHRPVPKEMSLVESMELSERKKNSKIPSVVASPMLNYDGKFPSSAETCFTVHGNGMQPYPDVVPSEEGSRYEYGYKGPCQDPPADENNYTPLFIPSNQSSKENTDYASLQRPNHPESGGLDYAELSGPDYAELQSPDYVELEAPNYADQGGPDYAELEPEWEQYTSLLSIAKDSRNGHSLSSCKQDAVYQTINKDEPVYHVLDSTSDSPIAGRRDPGSHLDGSQVKQAVNNSAPIYHVLDSTSDSPIAGRRDPRNYPDGSQVKQTANDSAPIYHVLEQENSCTSRGSNSVGTISGDQSKTKGRLESAGATSANLHEPTLRQGSPQENMYEALDESAAKSSKRNTYTASPRPKLKTSRSMTTFQEVCSEYTEPCVRPVAKSKPGKEILRTGHATEKKPQLEYLKPIVSSAASTQSGQTTERTGCRMAADSSSEYFQPSISPSSSSHFKQIAANGEATARRTSESSTYASPDYVVPNSVLPEGRFTIARNHQPTTQDSSFGVNDSRLYTDLTDNQSNAEGPYQALTTAQQPDPQTYQAVASNEADYVSVIPDEDCEQNSDMENPSYQTIVRTGYMNQR